MKTLLLYSPITDPTSGYHSLSYLAAYVEEFGYTNIDIIDVNIKAFNYSMEKEQFDIIMNYIKEKFHYLKNKDKLDCYEQIMLLYTWKTNFITYEDLKRAQYILKHDENFFNYIEYAEAVEIITNWLNAISTLGFPGQFKKGFGFPTNLYFNVFSEEDLSSLDILSIISKPFMNYYKSVLIPRIRKEEYEVVGINITYVSQIPFALYMGALIRKFFPDIKIIYGGTEVSDVWKYIKEKEYFFDIFNMSDACIIGEGETSFVELLNTFKNKLPLKSHKNILVNPKYGQPIKLNIDIKYEDISNLALPKYDKLEYCDYLSPYSYIYYSPSRGCYWNKCTFCDYGLNSNSPTSPWREYSVDKIISDLKVISQKHKFIYLSVDVLAPGTLLKMAERIVSEKIDIRWGAEIRLEKNWTIERCTLLKKSGCIAISVGFESGNQRILNLINKGTKVEKIKDTIINFSKSGIAVQIMGFTGFPSETFEESLDSINFLIENRKYWTFGGLGKFMLTKGSIIARNPEQFNIENLSEYKNEDIAWRIFYEDKTGGHGTKENEEKIQMLKGKFKISQLDRPWLGGVDTPHTFFYFDKFGLDVLKEIDMKKYFELYKNMKWELNGIIKEDIKGYPVSKLFDKKDLERIHKDNDNMCISNTSRDTMKILKENELKYDNEAEVKKIFVRMDGEIFPFPANIIEFLEKFKQRISLYEVMEAYEPTKSYENIIQYCVEHHFLRPVLNK